MLLCQTPADELQFILKARASGVLNDIDPDQYPENSHIGHQCMMCADSDQMRDTIKHHERVMESLTSRHGWLGMYGGALLIPAHSPINTGEGKFILEHFYLGYLLDKGSTIPLFSHGKCGMAQLYDLSVPACLQLLGDSKETTREFFRKRRNAVESIVGVRIDFLKRLQREVSHTELELETKLDRSEVTAIYRAEKLLALKGLSLSDVLGRPQPKVVAQYQVDYGTFGGEAKKRTYFFDRHAFNNLKQVRGSM